MHQRLFEITYLLVENGEMTAGELADRFGVSRRTIYRDIDVLSSAGIPVYTEKGRSGGIKILPEYILDKSFLSKSELKELIMNFQSLVSIGTPDTQILLDKLSAIFGRSEPWLEVDFAPWNGGEQAREQFRQLRNAIMNQNKISFQYVSADGVHSERVVEPIKILFRGQGWYLYGFCTLKNDFRIFKLTRIRQLQTSEESFSKRVQAPDLSVQNFNQNPCHLKLRFHASLAFRVYDEFPKDDIVDSNSMYIDVECNFPQGQWLLGYILSFGSDVEVLSPPEIREKVKTEIQKMSKIYEA